MADSTARDDSFSSSTIVPPPPVFPVYYHIDPSDVRHQKGSFGEAFAQHGKRFAQEKVQNWRSALKQVGDLSGWHTRNLRSEAELIEEIVSTLKTQLFQMKAIIRKSPSESDLLVKIQAKLASPEITNFLSKRLEPDKIKQSLVNFAKAHAKTSGEEWNNLLENISYLLDEAIEHVSLGREIIAEAKVNAILKELETMTEEDPFVHEQPISSEKKIIYFLQSYQESGSNNASVTLIVGVDKSQNTTLTGNVYRDKTVVASFELRGWVKFSVDQLDALSFIKSILESFNAGFDDGDDLQALMTQLRECLSRKKFLLVFDGFDSFQNWEIFNKCLEVAERGSSIILTAQKADITKIADCTFFLDQDVFSVSEAVRADFNLSEMESSDLPGSIYEQDTWKTNTSSGSHYLRKQPKLIFEEDVIPEEGHEDATLTSKETDSLIEGLPHAPEPQSPLTGANLATNSDDVIEALRTADHQEASDNDAEALGAADHQEVSDNDAEILRAADNQEASTAEILGVVDDQSEDSSDQDTFDFFSSLETIKISHPFQLKELPQKLHSLRIVECHFLESLAAELEHQSLSLSELYMIDCGFLKDFVDERKWDHMKVKALLFDHIININWLRRRGS
ncbi:hypothetical protein L6164_023386 [Bauhinia variegata]|uniref:Uncharacterized protein n=1 Tax=Bauhinia variegata TaxID=167791 RepID=A0ACB9MLE5_BAUVA|nr:hypothetical protein L6164_023386 [Bauhinia variegata]